MAAEIGLAAAAASREMGLASASARAAEFDAASEHPSGPMGGDA